MDLFQVLLSFNIFHQMKTLSLKWEITTKVNLILMTFLNQKVIFLLTFNSNVIESLNMKDPDKKSKYTLSNIINSLSHRIGDQNFEMAHDVKDDVVKKKYFDDDDNFKFSKGSGVCCFRCHENRFPTQLLVFFHLLASCILMGLLGASVEISLSYIRQGFFFSFSFLLIFFINKKLYFLGEFNSTSLFINLSFQFGISFLHFRSCFVCKVDR